jgi:hypothetical protein
VTWHGAEWPTLQQVIEAGALCRLAEEVASKSPDFALADIGFDIPIPATRRGHLRYAEFNVTQGKDFDSSAAAARLVPFVDESEIGLTTKVVADDFPVRHIPQLHLDLRNACAGQRDLHLYPDWCGCALRSPLWLKPDDVLKVEAERIGLLRNGVIDEMGQ